MSPGTAAARRGLPEIRPEDRLPPGLVKRVWRDFALPYKGKLLGFLIVIVLASGLQVLPPVIFGRLIDDGVIARDMRMVHVLAIAAVGVAVGVAVTSLVQRWLSASIGEGLILDLRQRLFDHVQRMPVAFFTRTQTGALISRLNNDVVGAQQAVTGTFGSVAANMLQLGAALVVMVAIDWRLTLLVLVVLPIFVGPARRVGRRLQRLTRDGMALNASMNTRMTERFNVAGALLVKLFGRYEEEAEEFTGRAKQVADIGVRTALVGRVFFVTLAFVGALGVALVYWVGGARAVTAGTFTPGNIVTFAGLVRMAYDPLAALTNARVEIMTAFVSFDRVFEILDLPHPIRERPGAAALAHPRGRVEFDRVVFSYPDPREATLESLEEPGALPRGAPLGTSVLRDVSFIADPGRTVALVGPSGAGKTTILNLVPRLYDVTEGAVRIDGHDVRDLTLESLADAVGVVTQDPHLFHDTVGVNLRYARPGASPEELEASCRAAQIHHVIEALPNGYDTVVGERGYRLSGGEKQRLSIARMLLKDPAIVLLDEATSHLDSESEAAVQRALAAALAGRTSIVIAHRLSTIVAADMILVVAQGRIVQRGTHAELVRGDGLYAELSRTQFGRLTAT